MQLSDYWLMGRNFVDWYIILKEITFLSDEYKQISHSAAQRRIIAHAQQIGNYILLASFELAKYLFDWHR